jgi:hypothetical protein
MANTTQINNYNGNELIVGLAKEATYGTVVAPTVYLSPETESLGVDNKLSTPMAARQTKGMNPPGIGSVTAGGNLTLLMDVDSMGLILANSMGLDTVSTPGTAFGTGGHLHTFTLANILNSMTVSVDNGAGYYHQYVGSKVGKLSISGSSGDLLKAQFDIMSQTDIVVSSGSLSSATWSTKSFMEFGHLALTANGGNGGSVMLNGVAVDIQKFSIALDNGIVPHIGSTGGRFAVGMDSVSGKVSGSFDIAFDSNLQNAIDLLLFGGTATGPSGGVVERFPLVLTFCQPNVSTYTPMMQFNMPNCTLQSAPLASTKGKNLSYACKFICSETTPGSGDDMIISLVNSTSTAYAP